MIKPAFAKTRRTLLLGLLTSLIGLPAVAQQAREEAGIRVRCLAFVIGAQPPPEVYAFNPAKKDAGSVKLEVKTFLNHQAETLPDGTQNLLLTTDPDPSSTLIQEKLVAKATLPDGARSVILLFVPGTGKAGDLPYRIFVVDDTRKAFPEGSLMVLNMSPTEVRFQLDEKDLRFKKGTTNLVKELDAGPDNLIDMRAFCRIGPGNAAKDWKRIAAARWAPPGKKRVFQVLFLDPVSQEIQLRGFTDVAKVVR
ncbi:hypothetical protein [Haloferula sargassicola]|uniref:Uncharacterized protein n=1 Tax=Haloferula sargassicola TaxID=490096 RepID=A0ABP9USH6_9BACT